MLVNKNDEIFSLRPNSLTLLDEKTQQPSNDAQSIENVSRNHRAISKSAQDSQFDLRGDNKDTKMLIEKIYSSSTKESAKFLGKVSLRDNIKKEKSLMEGMNLEIESYLDHQL